MNLAALPLFVGPAAILAVIAIPIRWRDLLTGWRLGAWATVAVVIVGLALRPLLPNLIAARPLIATITVGLGLPATGLLSVAISERWSWRSTIPLAVVAAGCGVLHTVTPAYAADPATVGNTVATADPLAALLLALASGQVPSGVTLLIVAGLMLRKVHELLEKIEKIQWKFTIRLDPETAIKEVHHYTAEIRHAPHPSPDEATEERSDVRKRFR